MLKSPAATWVAPNLEQLDAEKFQLCTPIQQIEHGRYLYRYQDQSQCFWLKTQLISTAHSLNLAAQLQHELACYDYFSMQHAGCILPFKRIEINQTSLDKN